MKGKDLRNVLGQKNIGINDLADKLNMSQSNLSKTFQVQDVKSGMLEKICDALGVTLDFFYEGTKYIKEDKSRDIERHVYGCMSSEDIVSERVYGEKTKEEEIMYLRGQVKALKEMNQMLIDRNATVDKSLSYQKKNA